MGLLLDSNLVWPIYNKSIPDWVLGDDREWSGSFPLALLLAGDTGLSDVYLTIKQSPTASDAQSLIQIHVTPVMSTAGIIVNGALNVSVVLRVLGENLIAGSGLAPGPYAYDIRGFAIPSQAVWTFESGQIQFLQNVTAQEAGGLPAALPNAGNPQFRGFICGGPPGIGTYNVGDWVRNSCPVSGAPSGWVCLVGGTPGTWVSDGIVGDDTGL